MQNDSVDTAIRHILKWSDREDWAQARASVFMDHLAPVGKAFDLSPQEIMDRLGAAAGPLHTFIMEDFLTARFGENGELNVIDDYLRVEGHREDQVGRRYLEDTRDAPLSLFEVIDSNPGRNVTARDLVYGGDPVTLDEKSGSRSMVRWDGFAGRRVEIKGRACLTGGVLLFPREMLEQVLRGFDKEARRQWKKFGKGSGDRKIEGESDERFMRRMLCSRPAGCQTITGLWMTDALEKILAPPPQLSNSDGETVVFTELRFPLQGGTSEISAILDGIEVLERDGSDEPSWVWLTPKPSSAPKPARGKGRTLMLEMQNTLGEVNLAGIEMNDRELAVHVNSAERAQRVRDLLVARLGSLVGPASASQTSPEEMMGGVHQEPQSPPTALGVSAEEAALLSQRYLDEHYLETLDAPLPILGGKTPREAATTLKGRRLAINWLKQLENHEFHQAAQKNQKPYDTSWIWEELGLEMPYPD